ncbi:sensor histidine kinase [Flavihumibacter fluvii]|uniref:sensor histidine kinase n=1 Tax=Flavihumibacter fluvii TaxID=2838157 RepID=UPI001BDDD3F2|nr:histidine kinase [Flavihumibacter fluvii]ULQ53175.1 histidine kinase [Flavihumibacter fluvii]
MTLQLPRYNSQDYTILLLIILPFTIMINTIILGSIYFATLSNFFIATILSVCSFTIYYTLCGGIAVLMKHRFRDDDQIPVRLTIMILSFLILSGLYLLLVFNLYSNLRRYSIEFNNETYAWAYISMGITNVFITLLHEGIDQYDKWRQNRKETEELKKAYQHSRLQGLKSQVNPHFLFNSLNSLSSLISEDEEKAEEFLDEMSMVYRYMLRNDHEDLVTLSSELHFLASYAALLKARFGEGLQLMVTVPEAAKAGYLPHLTLQTIVENAFTLNSVDKNKPLVIKIYLEGENMLAISNTLQPKVIRDDLDIEKGLDNLINKYQLLEPGKAFIEESGEVRIIRLPLLLKKMESRL